MKHEVPQKFNYLQKNINSTIDTVLQNHTSILQFPNTSLSSHPLPLLKTGFHQHESKDFSVSKLQKELKDITLLSDTLKELDFFWDAI